MQPETPEKVILSEIISRAETYVKQELGNDSSGHDWWHIYRVTKTARHLAQLENADLFVCELAALLHDIADEKLNASKAAGLQKVENWLLQNEVPAAEASHIMEIISTMSYNGGHNQPMQTLEGKIVQDADRLDALGALGIARTFAYAGHKGHLMHNPELAVRTEMPKEEYRNSESTAINHFYEKLLKLKDLMNTEAGKQMAAERHRFMEDFLKQFYQEWEATK